MRVVEIYVCARILCIMKLPFDLSWHSFAFFCLAILTSCISKLCWHKYRGVRHSRLADRVNNIPKSKSYMYFVLAQVDLESKIRKGLKCLLALGLITGMSIKHCSLPNRSYYLLLISKIDIPRLVYMSYSYNLHSIWFGQICPHFSSLPP